MQHPSAHVPGGPEAAAGSNLEDVLQKLRALQEVLFQRFRTEHEISEIPRALSTKTEVLNRLKRSYVEKSELYDQLRVRIHDLRERAIEAEREREHYEGQMDAIRTQREYEALDKEIRDAGEREVEVRRELQREEEHLDEMAGTAGAGGGADQAAGPGGGGRAATHRIRDYGSRDGAAGSHRRRVEDHPGTRLRAAVQVRAHHPLPRRVWASWRCAPACAPVAR